MDITETRVKLVNDANDRLKAYCSITIDGCFVVRDLKVIDGSNGLFVAMPSRKLATRCNNCGCKNHLRARFCNECGSKAGEGRSGQGDSRTKLHADVAHPINAECRQFIQERVIEEFQIEADRSKQPDYVATEYDDDYNEDEATSPYDSLIQELKAERQAERGQHDPEPTVAEELEVEAEPDVEAESDREPEPEPVAEFGADLEADTEPEFGADLEPAAEPETEFGADLEAEPEPEAEFGADLETAAEPVAEFKADLEPEPEPQRAAAEVEAPAAESGDDDFGAGLV